MSLNIFQLRSLKTRLTLFTLAILMTGIGSIAFYTSQVLRKNMEVTLGEQQFSTVSFVAAGINEDIEVRFNTLKSIAESISPAMMGNTPGLQKVFEHQLILNHMFNAGAFIARMDGTATASIPLSAERSGVNYMDRDFMAAALKEGKATVGRPVIGKKMNVPVFAMTVPIRDAQGKVIGALTGVTNLGQPSFLDRITESPYGKSGGYILVMPKDRLIITATDKSRIMQPLPAHGINPMIDRFLGGYEGSAVYTNPLGVEVLGSSRLIPVSDWILGVTLPAKEAFDPIRDMLLAMLFFALLAGTLIWWMLHRQLLPMSDTVKTLAIMSNSNQPPQPLPITRQDEIGDLIAGFNRLLKTLGEREEALRESEFHWKFAIEGSGDGVWDWNIETNQATYSKRWKEILGYAEADTFPSCGEWTKRFHPDDQASVEDAMQAYLGGKTKTYTIECRMRCKDDSYKWVLGRGIVVSRNADGKPLRMTGTTTDISERKQVEETTQTLRDQLIQATKMEAVGHLTAGIAHDFNNILGAILGYTELSKHIIAAGNPEAVERYLEEILKASLRAKELVAQMLTFSRLAPDTQGEEVPVTLLTPVVKEVISLLRSSIPSTIELNYQVNDPDIKAHIQPIHLHQIILNLGINARDAIGEYGKINITLVRQFYTRRVCDSCQHDFAGEFVKLTVSDTGTGIEQHILKNIFNPFFTTKGVGKGTGMGLSVVHGLVHALGGHIQVESILAKGTAISVLLPLAVTAATDVFYAAALENTGGTLAGLRIMLVDDELSMTAMLQEFLGMHGAQITSFNSPLAAWNAFEQHPDGVDIVITDETMPGLSGMHLAQRMMKLRAGLPVILCTGYSDRATPELAEQAGLAGFFYKPLKMNALLHKIRKVAQSV
jgi:PAS domain S-box-containing protein